MPNIIMEIPDVPDEDSDYVDSEMECELYSQVHYGLVDNNACESPKSLMKESNYPVEEELFKKLRKFDVTLSSHTINKVSQNKKIKEKVSCNANITDLHSTILDYFSDQEEWELIKSDSDNETTTTKIDLNIHIATDKDDVDSVDKPNACWKILPRDAQQFSRDKRRYFTTLKLRCWNCNEYGHLSNACSQPKRKKPCFQCGYNDHFSRSCPKSVRFPYFNVDMVCNRCGQFGHPQRECPDIWRQFHRTIKPGSLVTKKSSYVKSCKSYCFNCSKFGHSGYDCKKTRFPMSQPIVSPKIYKYDHWIYVKRNSNVIKTNQDYTGPIKQPTSKKQEKCLKKRIGLKKMFQKERNSHDKLISKNHCLSNNKDILHRVKKSKKKLKRKVVVSSSCTNTSNLQVKIKSKRSETKSKNGQISLPRKHNSSHTNKLKFINHTLSKIVTGKTNKKIAKKFNTR